MKVPQMLFFLLPAGTALLLLASQINIIILSSYMYRYKVIHYLVPTMGYNRKRIKQTRRTSNPERIKTQIILADEEMKPLP
jgi:hypothetical protein